MQLCLRPLNSVAFSRKGETQDMKHTRWQLILAVVLIVASVTLYFFHYLLFHDSHHIFLYLLGDIAFVPIEVLIVTLIIHKLLAEKEKQAVLSKLNMLIGVFFSEAGTAFLDHLSIFDRDINQVDTKLREISDWSKKELSKLTEWFRLRKFTIEIDRKNIEALASILKSNRGFLATLLQNPVLLEHDTFTNLLQSLFHLEEEFTRRLDMYDLSDQDEAHIKSDIETAYIALLVQWIDYMGHLWKSYPNLFMFAIATNPLTTRPPKRESLQD